MLRSTFASVLLSVSLFGGFAFADAPISSINLNSDHDVSTPEATPSPTQTVPQVVDSQALLSSLSPDERIARLENQVQYLSSYNTKLQNLSIQVDTLRGHLEDAQHQISLLQKQVSALSPVASKAPLTPLSEPKPLTPPSTKKIADPSAAKTKAPGPFPGNTTATNPKEQAAFDQAYHLLAQKEYDQAVISFKIFLKNYPHSNLAPTAHYWLGDLYLAEGQPDKASAEYRTVANIKTAPKRPDAMVKLGTILLAYGDSSHAKTLFQSVITDYPNTPAAKQAKSRLKGL